MVQSNFWSRFLALLPSTPRLLGDIAVAMGGGQYLVTLIGGGSIRAMSSDDTLTAGTRVFVREGVIEAKAPALPPLTIEV